MCYAWVVALRVSHRFLECGLSGEIKGSVPGHGLHSELLSPYGCSADLPCAAGCLLVFPGNPAPVSCGSCVVSDHPVGCLSYPRVSEMTRAPPHQPLALSEGYERREGEEDR